MSCHVVIPRYGPPEVLDLRTLPRREPGPSDVVIKVRTAGLNFADVLARMGLYPDAPRLPLTPGYEVCGTVEAAGSNVSNLSQGDRVIGVPRFGGYATDVVVPAALALQAPASLNDEEAAALPVNYLTAWLALYRCANLQAGETVLLHGAAGGVGLAVTQLARLRGATVIGTASTAKHEAIRALGVAHTLDSRAPTLVGEVRRLTHGRGVDVVIDSVGGRSFADSYRLLAPLGRLVVCGVSSIAPGLKRRWWTVVRTIAGMPKFKPLSLMNRNRGVFGINLAHLWDERDLFVRAAAQLMDEVTAGHIRPVIARSFPLEQAADAHRFIQERRNIGKVVLTVKGR